MENKFIARCSRLGELMTEPRLKKEKDLGLLSETAKSYIEEVFTGHKTGYREEIHDQKLIKGKLCEEQAISLVQRVRGNKSLLIKNDERRSNGYISGEWDLFDQVEQEVIDTKVAWNAKTFHQNEGLFTKTGKLTAYGWQLIGYAWLANVRKATLAYTWIDTPEFILQDLIRRAYFKYDHNDDQLMATLESEIEANIYLAHCPKNRPNPVPDHECVRQWTMTITMENYIPLITQKVEQANLYYNQLEKSWKTTQFLQQLSA